jgi:hypothetical protein
MAAGAWFDLVWLRDMLASFRPRRAGISVDATFPLGSRPGGL